ncbi:MAG: hypothetical protein ACI4QR_04275, partial [Eubacteriales bacterium]
MCGKITTSFRRTVQGFLNYNPSVTAAPCHLPLHKGGLLNSNKIASVGWKSKYQIIKKVGRGLAPAETNGTVK